MADDPEDEVEATFDDQGEYFAKKLVLDAHDIGETYKHRPESLKAYFNAHAERAPSWEFGGPVALVSHLMSVFSPATLVVTLPATIAVGCVVGRIGYLQQSEIGDAVRNDVEAYRTAGSPPPTPAGQRPT